MYGKLEEETFPRSINSNFNFSAFLVRGGVCALAFGGLVILSPLLVVCAALVRFSSPGSIFFRKKRVGRGGRIFTLYKFRTMVESKRGLLITAENDNRITPFGRILRKTKIDELPELYNILLGDMSFVGPRPEVVEMVDFNNPQWKKVLSVRPGITDPVTLEFRNEEFLLANVEDKSKFYREVIQPYKIDGYLRYLKTKSLKRDLMIVAETFKVVLLPKTAPPIRLSEIQKFAATERSQ
jgi:lipopolysaccharide/colanic/teichoic acid biosynthesis glycosyltransferase